MSITTYTGCGCICHGLGGGTEAACLHCRPELPWAAEAQPPPVPEKRRSTWIRYPEMDRLDRWGAVLFRATGEVPYLVGSALERRDFGDVDVRIILDDHVYDALFPAPKYHPQRAQALWSMLCEAISVWGREQTGLPIDFQFQRRTEANTEEPGAGHRNALGMGKWDRDEVHGWVLR